MVERSPEKAGVGGSTPSLATIFPKDLDDFEQNSSVRSQSALVRCVAKNCNQHCPFCSHAILADTMGVTLKGHLDITVAKQSLYRFRIGLDADEERCKAVAQIMEAESPWVIVYQFAIVVPVR